MLAAGLRFINQSGNGAIVLTGAEARQLGDLLGQSRRRRLRRVEQRQHRGLEHALGGTVTATGDRYVFAFQPTITVTSGN